MFKSIAKRKNHGTLLPNDPKRCVNKHPIHLRAPPTTQGRSAGPEPFRPSCREASSESKQNRVLDSQALGNQRRALLPVKETLVGEEANLTVNSCAAGGEFREHGR